MARLGSIFFMQVLLVSCLNSSNNAFPGSISQPAAYFNPGSRVKDIPLPAGYYRGPRDPASFAFYLGNRRLKKDKTVYLYNGLPKQNQSAQYAVLDIPVGNKDLQQCADAVMRLRAEYLFEQQQFDHIIFYDNDGRGYLFSAPYNRAHFNTYLNRVFGMCGSASLSKQLKPVARPDDMVPGDVLIRGGFPGHAVIVMDVAINEKGKKIYLLAQSYMPAQDIHILVNPLDDSGSPWYPVNEAFRIITPEYTFTRNELKAW